MHCILNKNVFNQLLKITPQFYYARNYEFSFNHDSKSKCGKRSWYVLELFVPYSFRWP